MQQAPLPADTTDSASMSMTDMTAVAQENVANHGASEDVSASNLLGPWLQPALLTGPAADQEIAARSEPHSAPSSEAFAGFYDI